jgi:hypothetical protein
MQNRKSSWALTALIIAATPFMASSVSAEGGLNKATNMVCSIRDVVGCIEGSRCLQGSANSFELPEMMIIDTKKKHMKSTYESGHNAISPINNIEKNSGQLMLQGFENNHGWSIAIDTKTGSMSGSGVGKDVSFLVFGVCTGL